jgi:hypothetical protein
MRPARALPLLALALGSLLAGCGAEPLALPEEPVDRAATCGVVAAATARSAVRDVKAPLPMEAQGRILHFALLAASDGGEFQPGVANRVSERMSAIQAKVVEGKWKDLAPACEAAYPATIQASPKLPEGRLDAQLACEGLGDFVATAMEGHETDYGNEIAAIRRMRREVNDALAPGLRSRAGNDLDAQKKERRRALAAAARLGSPVAVLERCAERFKPAA